MVVKPITSSHSKYKSILLISRRCTAPFTILSKMVYSLFYFHSFNKYMLSAYSGHVEQESYRPCPPRAHNLTEKADTNYLTV